MLLGNRYAVKWTDLLAGDWGFPVSRVSLDLNSDGKQDVLYRVTGSLSWQTFHSLFWTDSYPAGESVFSIKRFREIAGAKLTDPKWAGALANDVLLSSNRYEADIGEYVTTITPPLPDGLRLPSIPLIDIVHVHGRDWIVLAPAWYIDRPLAVFVFQSRGVRDHSLVCLFKGNFILTRP